MILLTDKIKNHFCHEMEQEQDLNNRLSYILDHVLEEISDQKEISLFEFLQKVLVFSDNIPAECILNLMITADSNYSALEKNVVNKSAEFLRGHFKMKTSNERGLK